jgi:hypothetical protein
MKSNLRRPFRAPREAVDRSKGGKVADQLDIEIGQLHLTGYRVIVKRPQH